MNYEGLDSSFLIVLIRKLLLNENSLKKNNCLEVVTGFQAGQIMKCDFNLMKLNFLLWFCKLTVTAASKEELLGINANSSS